MNKLKYIVVAFLAGMLFTGCDDYLDVNDNPDKGTYSTPEEELPLIMFYASQCNYDHAEYGMYLAQAWTTGGRSQSNSYAYKGGWEFLSMNRHPQWRRHYYDLGVNIKEMLERAEEKKSYNFVLIGRTIRLMSTQLTTDVFGDMPLTEAYTSLAPKYDTQESIYEWMLNEADELLRLYDDPSWTQAPTNITITERMDRIYKGDLSKWKAFTSALKARILLRKLPNWENNTSACQAILDAVSGADPDNFAEPDYVYPGGLNEKSSPWSEVRPIINSWESRGNEMDKALPTTFLCERMMGLGAPGYALGVLANAHDPRLGKLMVPREGPSGTDDQTTKIRCLDSNIGMDISYKESNYPNLYSPSCPYTLTTGYVSLMLKEELYLIKAEAQWWMNDVDGAYESTVKAVQSSFERFEVSAARLKDYQKPRKKLAGDTETIYDLPSVAQGFDIGHIMRQKYICLYMQPEMWNDMRRYCYSNGKDVTYKGVIIYPGLRRPYNLYEPYWIGGDNEGKWLQRINYDPQTEEKYNRNELLRLGAYRNYKWLQKPMIWSVYNKNVQ